MIRDLRITKVANRDRVPAAGQAVTYTVTATNIGNAAYTDTTGQRANVYDDVGGAVDDAVLGSITRSPSSLPAPTTSSNRISWSGPLGPGASVVLTYSMTVRPDAQLGDKIMTNVARASSTPVSSDAAIVCPPESADLMAGLCARVDLYRVDVEVTKRAHHAETNEPIGDGTSVPPGTPVVWRYTVRNTGSIALTGIQLTDSATETKWESGDSMTVPLSLEISCDGTPAVTPGTTVTIPTLAPGAQRVCQAEGVIGGT